MSDPKRYSIVADYQAPWAKMHEFSAGGWVKWEDYARLKAEVELLTAEVSFDKRVQLHVDKLVAEFTQCQVERLQAEVERLRKAGDGLYKSMLEIGCNEMADNFQYDDWWGSMRAWQSAKEGKQP